MKNQSGKENVSGFLYCLRSLLTLILHTHTFYYHTKPNGSSRKRSSIGIRIFEANTELPDRKLTDSMSIATSKSEINIYFVFSWILRCSLDMSSHTTHTYARTRYSDQLSFAWFCRQTKRFIIRSWRQHFLLECRCGDARLFFMSDSNGFKLENIENFIYLFIYSCLKYDGTGLRPNYIVTLVTLKTFQ